MIGRTSTKVPHANPGNFIALLHFKMESGYTVLADHLASCGKHSLYTSKTVQNELIEICGSIIQSTLLNYIHAARILSIMADEAADASNKEQLSLCIRFVNHSSLKIEERFMCFSECDTGTTGEAIADCILSQFRLLAAFSFNCMDRHMIEQVQWQERGEEQLLTSLTFTQGCLHPLCCSCS